MQDDSAELIADDDPPSDSEALGSEACGADPTSTPARDVSTDIERRPRKRRRGDEDSESSPLVVRLFRELLGAVKPQETAPLESGEELRRQLQETTAKVVSVEAKVESQMIELKTQLDQILAAVSSQAR